jgi:hypothetical protein
MQDPWAVLLLLILIIRYRIADVKQKGEFSSPFCEYFTESGRMIADMLDLFIPFIYIFHAMNNVEGKVAIKNIHQIIIFISKENGSWLAFPTKLRENTGTMYFL